MKLGLGTNPTVTHGKLGYAKTPTKKLLVSHAGIDRADNPERARAYLSRIIELGIGGPPQRQAEQMLAELR
jgi:hypothetical protein